MVFDLDVSRLKDFGLIFGNKTHNNGAERVTLRMRDLNLYNK